MDFNEAATFAKQLVDRLSYDEMLALYGMYKQITSGNCNKSCPSIFHYKERAKWNEWNSHKGKDIKNLKRDYIGLVEKCLEKYSTTYGQF